MEQSTKTTPQPGNAPVQSSYITNPFSVALEGINRFKDKANGLFILSLVLGVIGLLSNGGGNPFSESSNNQDTGNSTMSGAGSIPPEVMVAIIVVVAIIMLSLLLVTFIIWGMFCYTSAQLALGKGATISEAFNGLVKNFWRFTAVSLIMFFRLFGWYLLFVVPGIIMHYRYSLSGLVAFAEPELKPAQVVSRSAQLTKGAWFDTFGSFTSFTLITFGVMQIMTEVGASAVMYRQLKHIKEVGEAKPQTHILNYLLLIIPIILLTSAILILIFTYAYIDSLL